MNSMFKKATLIALVCVLVVLIVLCIMVIGDKEKEPQESSVITIQQPETPDESEISDADESSQPQPDVVTSASLLFTGDNLIHNNMYNEAKQRATEETREYDFKPMYKDIADIVASYDLAFINQETPMAGESFGYSNYPRFNTPQDLGYDLIEMGFDIINIANNHMLDKGERGLAGTIEFLRSLPAAILGDYMTEDEYGVPEIVEVNGITIAFLSYTYDTNGMFLPSSSELVVPYIDEETLLAHIQNAKGKADLLFVSMHWGEENSKAVSEDQKKYAAMMADAGVDAVIGHHPHVLQPIEWIDGRDGHKMLCFYSLGNLSGTMVSPINMVGGLFTFEVTKINDQKPIIDNVLFIPTVFYYDRSYGGTNVYLLEEFTEELAKTHGTQNYTRYAGLDELWKYATNAIDEEFFAK